MIKKLLFGAGMAWLARKFMGGRSDSRAESRRGRGMGSAFGMGRGRRGW